MKDAESSRKLATGCVLEQHVLAAICAVVARIMLSHSEGDGACSFVKRAAKIPACGLQAGSISNNRIARRVKFILTPDASLVVPNF